MPTITLSKDNEDFYDITESGATVTTSSTYVRYNNNGTGNWIRASITVPANHKYTVTQFYTTYTGYHSSHKHGYGFSKEKRDTYVYNQNSSFTYSVISDTYGSSAGNTYTTSVDWELEAGTWYLYIYQSVSGGAIQFLTTNNTTIQITYTDIIIPYTVTYESNGGSGTTIGHLVAPGNSITLASNNFTPPLERLFSITLDGNGGRDGVPKYSDPPNSFYRWRKDSLSGTAYNAGASFTPTENTIFYAQWRTGVVYGTTTRDPSQKDGYTVTFNANGGVCDTKTLTAKEKTLYTFKEWNTAEDGSGTAQNSTSTYYLSNNTTVRYAIWNSTVENGVITLPTASNISTSELKITFDYQGGKGIITSSTTSKEIKKEFKGWATSSSSSSGVTGEYTPKSNHTLYAVWGEPIITYGTITLPSPSRDGYTFLGWATSPTASSGAMGEYTPDSDITVLYAIWGGKGNVRIYIEGSSEYKMALVFIYSPKDSEDANPWKLALPYSYSQNSDDDTAPWKLVSG